MNRKDYYYRKAKKEKYRSRASYKLKQLNEKFKVIRPGDGVLELGASPGGWTQVIREIVGDEGFVLGVDLDAIRPMNFENVKFVQGDFTNEGIIEEIERTMPLADAVVSDASPDISGVWDIDHIRSVDLSRNALLLAKKVLKPGGKFLLKIFQGAQTDEFFKDVKASFNYSKRTKPRASRDRSAEIYIVGKGFSR